MMMLMLVPKLQGRGPPPATVLKGVLRQDDAADGMAVPLLVPPPSLSLSFGRSEVFQTRNWEDKIK